ncbi:hypothetical protein BGZ58_010767 [Dissophora ornata]|nr:hypothetical protein BGZ58_010767 [Dissophora ornata]
MSTLTDIQFHQNRPRFQTVTLSRSKIRKGAVKTKICTKIDIKTKIHLRHQTAQVTLLMNTPLWSVSMWSWSLLVDRVYELERLHFDFDSDSLSSLSSDSEASDSSVLEEARSKRTSPSRASVKVNGSKSVRGTPSTAATIVNAQHPKKTAVKSLAAKETKAQATPSTPSTITNVGSATQKPKRIHQTNKLRMGLAKVRKVQLLEKDEAGNVKLPVTVGIITIQSIGDVVYDREAFHNDRYIFPVGYKMSRSYNSMIDLNNQTTYTCSVIDDGEAPKFQIDAEDQPGKPIIAGTATGAWTHVVKAANAIRKRDHSNSASGPDYFGFSNATIAKMIQDLPNVDKCQSYIMQRFEEPSASTASSAKTAGGEKRKMSARSSTPKAGGDHNEEEGDHDAGEDDNEDAYASLGTPGKKKARVSSPKTRHASFDAPTAAMAKENVRASDTSIEHHETIDDGDESDETQSDFDPEDRRPLSPKLEAGLVHSIAASGHSQSPIVVTASGDSEMIDIEEHDSEVDVGMDESASSVQDPLAQPPAAPGIPADGQDRATDVAST